MQVGPTFPSQDKRLPRALTARDTAAIWAEMRQQLAEGKTPRAEDFLQRWERQPPDEQAVVDLAYAEYVLSLELGSPRDPDELCRRFPQYRSALERQLALHDALSTLEASDPACGLTSTVHDREGCDLSKTPAYLGRYLLLEKIGTGGQAEVYKALHPELHKEVVVKLGLRPTITAGPRASGLLAEGRALAQLEHPNLARVYDLDYVDGRPMLVVEFIPGRALSQWAPLHKPTPQQSALLVAKVARAAAAAHRRGIIHRDIKPANIVVDNAHEPRLIDFGLSQLQDAWSLEHVEQGGFSGTLAYMAPEQARHDSALADARSDVFALGGVLYFLLTGRAPYVGDDFQAIYTRVRRGEWDSQPLQAPGIDARLRAICTRALAAAPDERYSSADMLTLDLERYAQRRLPLRNLLMATFAVALLAMGVWHYLTASGTRPPERPAPHLFAGAPRSAARAAPQLEEPSLRVGIWDSGRYLELTEVGPARTGDQLQVTARVPAGVYASLFLFTSEGELKLLGRVNALRSEQTLRYPPSEDQSVPLIGPVGTEMLLVCGDEDEWVTVESLAIAPLAAAWPALSEATVLRLNAQGVEWVMRGRDFGPLQDRPDPNAVVRRHLDELGQSLQSRYPFFEALAFAHRD